ncbi:hypothetical protein I7I51_01028 [Histoplasma capsulatum]|uniref:Uncharacterized protein n=1 Tax=Ajellomyces capsulatus TaxID=5037 RepID=A0A8A1MIN1_AJECA|nr:hypothetical protein I7I51_01028 [Histoplasma capsulatum]
MSLLTVSRQQIPADGLNTAALCSCVILRDILLRAFFAFVKFNPADEEHIDSSDERLANQIGKGLATFADFLLENFFLPQSRLLVDTPHNITLHIWAIQTHEFTGTRERISDFQGPCLIRDHHRCVISRVFDQQEMVTRPEKYGNTVQSDEGTYSKDCNLCS